MIMTEPIKIYKGIPLPTRRGRKPGSSKYRLDELKVGEAVHVTRAERASIISGWHRFAPKKFTSELDSKDRNMCYVWRVK